MKEFKELGISASVLKAIDDQKFEKPTRIQEETIGPILEGRDIIAGSATGSGKTLAFGVGVIQNTKRNEKIQAIILTPTRELAVQIGKELKKLTKYEKRETAVVYGGVGLNPQIKKLKTSELVVGTPGRMLDHIQRGTINLSDVEIVVLDEADRMLDMGFIDDVKRIINHCKKRKQTMLFSATITPEVESLTKNYLHNPQKTQVDTYVDPSKLKQEYYDVDRHLKFSLLVHLLKQEKNSKIMIFSNSRRYATTIARNLKKQGLNAEAIHGGFSQYQRSQTLEKFHENKINILVCTDVASRGLDIQGVTHVYNYDIPDESKQYIHRIGRTARAGEKGLAVTLLSDNDHTNFGRVLESLSVEIEVKETPYIKKIEVEQEYRRPQRGGFHRHGHNQHQHNTRR